MLCVYRPITLPAVDFMPCVQVFVWSRESGVEGVKDCGNGWKMAADPHACSEPITAISVAPVILEDNR